MGFSVRAMGFAFYIGEHFILSAFRALIQRLIIPGGFGAGGFMRGGRAGRARYRR